MELPYLSGKTIKTISAIESDGSIDEVRITHSDGAVLIITGEYIKIRFEPAQPQPAHVSAVSAVSSGIAAMALQKAIEKDKATVTQRSKWPGE